MWQSFTIFGFSFVVTLCTTPLMIWLSKKTRALDHPNSKLKPQKHAIPYLGGVAIFLGFSLSLLLSNFICGIDLYLVFSILISSVLMILVGFLDDRYDIKGLKLYAHIGVGILIALLGFHFNFVSSQLLRILLTVSIVVITCNSLNLIDGVDGLASGVVLIASAFFFILFAISRNIAGIVISLGLIGSVSAFLIFNFSPATIYLGNNGSLFLGLIIAVMMIMYPASANFNFILATLIILAIPITDTILAFIRRIINHRSFLCGDRSHFYDHLLRNGLPLKRMIVMIYIICSVLGGIAILTSIISFYFGLTLFFLITLCFTIIIMKMKLYQIND